jgi:hypothetical protein
MKRSRGEFSRARRRRREGAGDRCGRKLAAARGQVRLEGRLRGPAPAVCSADGPADLRCHANSKGRGFSPQPFFIHYHWMRYQRGPTPTPKPTPPGPTPMPTLGPLS